MIKNYNKFILIAFAILTIVVFISCENANKTYPMVRVHRSSGSFKYFAYARLKDDGTYEPVSADWLYASKHEYTDYVYILTTGEFYLLADVDSEHTFSEAFYVDLLTLEFGKKYTLMFNAENKFLLLEESALY